MDRNDEFFARACGVFAGGVNSPVRAFGSVGGVPKFIARGEGCWIHDEDGAGYIDYVGSWGPLIAGHAQPAVVEAVCRAMRDGSSFGATTRLEIELAEEIVDRVPSVEKVRLTNSGTEAAMTAIRLARAVTGRNVIVKFAGCYHGHSDALLVRAGSGVATLGLPDSPGVPTGAVDDTRLASFNNTDEVQSIVAAEGSSIAAVIVEPVAGNMGVVPPEPGFLEALRNVTRATGALLIFDEVMTGFRVARGGAEDRFGVRPDLSIFGKVIGGGLPVGAVGGSAAIMDHLAPSGPVYQAGTLSGNPLAMAAGLATMRLLDADAYNRLESNSAQLEDGIRCALRDSSVDGAVQRLGSMLSVFFGREAVHNLDHARAADHKRYAAWFHALLRRGVYLPPSGYESWFVSLAHGVAVVKQTITAAAEALVEVAERG